MSAAAWAQDPVGQVKSSTGAGTSVAAWALDEGGQAVASVAAGLNDVVDGNTSVAAWALDQAGQVKSSTGALQSQRVCVRWTKPATGSFKSRQESRESLTGTF